MEWVNIGKIGGGGMARKSYSIRVNEGHDEHLLTIEVPEGQTVQFIATGNFNSDNPYIDVGGVKVGPRSYGEASHWYGEIELSEDTEVRLKQDRYGGNSTSFTLYWGVISD